MITGMLRVVCVGGVPCAGSKCLKWSLIDSLVTLVAPLY